VADAHWITTWTLEIDTIVATLAELGPADDRHAQSWGGL